MQPDWPLGTHLTTPRRGYVHHGIYAGDGHVIHYAGYHRLFRRGPVLETTVEQFSRGRGINAESGAVAPFDGTDAVARARSRLGEDRYRVWTNNCEHFVHWCLSGMPRSMQVERWARPLRPLRAAITALRAPQRGAAALHPA
jgi:hypothetical protein